MPPSHASKYSGPPVTRGGSILSSGTSWWFPPLSAFENPSHPVAIPPQTATILGSSVVAGERHARVRVRESLRFEWRRRSQLDCDAAGDRRLPLMCQNIACSTKTYAFVCENERQPIAPKSFTCNVPGTATASVKKLGVR
jgi:hypothetical protein